jgi:hypothetical protein
LTTLDGNRPKAKASKTNIRLAADTAHERRGVVLDVSVRPPRIVYKDGRVLVEGEK